MTIVNFEAAQSEFDRLRTQNAELIEENADQALRIQELEDENYALRLQLRQLQCARVSPELIVND